jgi:hypothetical protein
MITDHLLFKKRKEVKTMREYQEPEARVLGDPATLILGNKSGAVEGNPHIPAQGDCELED